MSHYITLHRVLIFSKVFAHGRLTSYTFYNAAVDRAKKEPRVYGESGTVNRHQTALIYTVAVARYYQEKLLDEKQSPSPKSRRKYGATSPCLVWANSLFSMIETTLEQSTSVQHTTSCPGCRTNDRPPTDWKETRVVSGGPGPRSKSL